MSGVITESSHIISDIVEDINLKPKTSKIVLKWVIRIGIILIFGAFIIGQLKSSHINKLDEIQKSINENTIAINNLEEKTSNNFDNINLRIDKIYDDGFNMFNDFQIYNKKQLEIIVEYGQTNKELVMKMLDVNSVEKTKNVEINLQQKKKEKIEINPQQKKNISIGVKPAVDDKNN